MVKNSGRGQFKGRNTGSRKRNRIILMAAEGTNKTETQYFRKFSSDSTRIYFTSGNETDPQKMMERLLKECDDRGIGNEPGDRAFCLVDNDVNLQKDIQIAVADTMAKKKSGIAEQIVSNPCFEVWYICHKDYSTKQYSSSNEVIEVTKRRFDGYKKEAPDMYEKTITDINTACENAKKLEQHNLSLGRKPHTAAFLPSTEVYKVIEAILTT